LIFQTLDDKNECVGTYAEGKLSFDELPDDLTACWAPVPYLEGKEIDYASLYCEGKTPDQICPDNLRDDWDECNEKMKAFYRSFMLGRVSLDENCFFLSSNPQTAIPSNSTSTQQRFAHYWR